MGEIMDSVLLNCHHILNSAAIFAEKIDAGLNGKDLADLQLSAESAGIKSRTFVDKKTYRVTERVTESTFVLGNGIDNISCNLICLAAIRPLAKVP